MDYFQSSLRQSIVLLITAASLFYSTFTCASTDAPAASNDPLKGTELSAGLSFPTLITLGVARPLLNNLSIHLETGYMPYPFFSSLTLAAGGVEIRAQWRPLSNGLFILAGLGYQAITFKSPIDLSAYTSINIPNTGTFNFNILYLSAGMGFSWKVSEKIWMSTDIAVQIPLANFSNLGLTDQSPAAQSLQSATKGTLEYFANLVIPRLNILRVGFTL